MASDSGLREDTTDAKGFLGSFVGKLMCGTVRSKAFMDIKDIEEEDIQEAYKKVPPAFKRKELLSDMYKMDFPRRGIAVVINNKNFSPEMEKKGYGVRTGTDVDATRICSRLKMLGFEVDRYHDATCKQMKMAFSGAAAKDHSDADCFVGVILSHGEKDKVFGTDGPVDTNDIFQYFKGYSCKSLAGKPKIFFIQACRGHQLDEGVNMNVADAKPFQYEAKAEEEEEIRIPNEADFIVSYSTVPGYYSWRNSANGSWYVQALVHILDKYGTTMELQKLLTQLNKMVAYTDKFMSNTLQTNPSMHGMKQIPSFTSMLTKDLYFVPKK
ncbi:caspase-3-like [Mercenaria mercenaria]|uniref:caspase-3-like n=1 Tax=Mercenaria mercenaria TaxID=6596 RepID=UPI00234F653C|nr:caspase-3-like [Mercenaria mercenaria]